VTGYAATHRLLVNAILGQTSLLVRNALGGNWSAAAAAADRRRRMLGRLEKECLPQEEQLVMVLRQAVEESEQALAHMGSSHRIPPAGPSRPQA
jgi:hypothetical protein